MANQIQELEKRLETLEQEVQLLMAQVQYTLLEIQEHLLHTAYPALRSASTPEIEPEIQRPVPAPQPPVQGNNGLEGVRRVRLQPDTPLPEELPQVTVSAPVAPIQAAVAPTDVARQRDMEEWALQRIQQIGVERTRQLIDIYSRNGQFTPALSEGLYQLINSHEDMPQPTIDDPLPDVIRRAVEQPTTVKAAAARPANRSAYSAGSNTPDKRPAPKQAARSKNTPGAHRSTSPVRTMPVAVPAEQSVSAPPNLVLRLIAGVQSAGIGITRRNSHG